VQEAAKSQFEESGTAVSIYLSESEYTKILVDLLDRFRLSYLQLWLFALRQFLGLTSENPKKDSKGDCKAKTRSKAVWH
jgi:hypothetical protein